MSPPVDLTDEERAALVAMLTTEIEARRFPSCRRGYYAVLTPVDDNDRLVYGMGG
jgi:hypothetical protein